MVDGDWLTKKIYAIGNAIGDWFSKGFKDIWEGVKKAGKWIYNRFQNYLYYITFGLLGKAPEGLSYGNIFDAITNTFKSIFNKISNIKEMVKKWAKEKLSKIPLIGRFFADDEETDSNTTEEMNKPPVKSLWGRLKSWWGGDDDEIKKKTEEMKQFNEEASKNVTKTVEVKSKASPVRDFTEGMKHVSKQLDEVKKKAQEPAVMTVKAEMDVGRGKRVGFTDAAKDVKGHLDMLEKSMQRHGEVISQIRSNPVGYNDNLNVSLGDNTDVVKQKTNTSQAPIIAPITQSVPNAANVQSGNNAGQMSKLDPVLDDLLEKMFTTTVKVFNETVINYPFQTFVVN